MLTFRPYKIQYSTQGAGSVSSNGDYTPATRVWGDEYDCNAISDSKPKTFFYDGEQYQSSYKVLLDANVPSLSFGDMVRLRQNGVLIGEFRVLGFQRNQLSSYAWL